MRVIRLAMHGSGALWCSRAPIARGSAMVVGNFDGMHVGHQAMLSKLLAIAKPVDLVTTVVLFEPQPKEYFAGDQPPPRLMRCRDKLAYCQALGIDQVVVLRFDAHMAACEASDFLLQVLIGVFNMRQMLVCEGFRFGHRSLGDVALLTREAPRHGYKLHHLEPCVSDGGERVSSSRVRAALFKRQLPVAQALLCRHYAISGRVSRGKQLARAWGFPTLNIRLQRPAAPLMGVYAVTVEGLGSKVYRGVASCGTRPMVHAGAAVLLEAHVFDFNEEVYGTRVTVYFHHYQREEQRFESIAALREQIAMDAAEAKRYFESTKE